MAPVTTHAGGPFYVWYQSVYGYGPPATVDSNATRYLAWQQGVPKSLAKLIPYGAMGSPAYLYAAEAGSALAPPPPPAPVPAPVGLAQAGSALLPAQPGAPAPTAVLSAPVASQASVPILAAGDQGTFTSTAYGPPWGGIQGNGVTATGVDLRDSPHKYIIAVDPSVIPLHSHCYCSPNPFNNDTLVFAAEDTGGAIKGKHIDFYDWRGRASQLSWGVRNTQVIITTEPVTSGGADEVAGYYNPLEHANVTPERIDQGVDYAGTGYLTAIADGIVRASVANGSGWEGEGFIMYEITQPGFLYGAYVYYAEGVDTVVSVDENVRGGARLCNLRQPMPHGIEIGFGAGYGEDSYYRYHDGAYHDGDATRPGIAMSNLIQSLGGPPGKIEGAVVGNFPEYMPSGEPPAGITRGAPSAPLSSGQNETIPAGTAAGAFDFPSSYYSAFVQIQRGADNGSHHSHAAQAELNSITYVPMAS